MLARFIRSYHRPDRMSETLALLARGGLPLAGGTRLLAAAAELPEVVDLAALGLADIEARDGELHLGAMVTLQDVIDSPLTYGATGGLLPTACRAQSSSRQLRGMATLGGESAQSDPDSEVVAALLALDARVVVTGPGETVEIPALRFVRTSARERVPGSLITRIVGSALGPTLAGGGRRRRAGRGGLCSGSSGPHWAHHATGAPPASRVTPRSG